MQILHFAERNVDGDYARVMVDVTTDTASLNAYRDEAVRGGDPQQGGVNGMSWYSAYNCAVRTASGRSCMPSTATSAALDWTRDQLSGAQNSASSKILILITDGVSQETCAHVAGASRGLDTVLLGGDVDIFQFIIKIMRQYFFPKKAPNHNFISEDWLVARRQAEHVVFKVFVGFEDGWVVLQVADKSDNFDEAFRIKAVLFTRRRLFM